LVAAASKAGGSNTVHHINTLNGVSVPITFVADPNQVITGPSVCYITADQDTFCFQKDADAISASATTPFPIDAAAYDDAASELVMLSTAAFKLMRYDELLAGAPTILDIPTAVPMGANPRLAINPQDGKVWVSSDGSSTLTGLSENAGGGPMDAEFLTHPLIVAPEGIDFDDRGNLYVATGGGIVEFEPSVGGGWQPVAIPLFGTAAAQGMLHIARSRTNATAVHNGPDWANIPHGERVIIGTEMLDCYADLDGDRLVGITDLLQLLAAWGPCGALCIADIDANGDVGITDLLTLLAAWGPCP